MANNKSAKKRIGITAKKTLRNKIIKSRTKTCIKKVISAVNEQNAALAKASYIQAVSYIDKAASKGVFHKKTASRKKSRLAKMVNKIA